MNRRLRVAGIPVVVEPSWLIIAVLVVWILFATLAGMENTTSLPAELAIAVVGSLAFFASLLVHELSHSVVARRRGVAVRRIRLFVFGGVSEIEQEAATPQDELAITAAGPVASLALGAAFLVLALAVPASTGAVDQSLELLAVLNAALAVFNLLPGFPLDGGRVLRALIWRVTGDFGRATVVAVAGGRLVAGLLGLAGLALLFAGPDPAGLWWIAVGAFLWVAAGRALAQHRLDERLAGVAVEAVMRPAGPPADPTAAADDLLLDGAAGIRPVVTGGRVRGLVDVDWLRKRPPAERAGWSVADVMSRVGPSSVVEAGVPAADILRSLGRFRYLVVVRDGRMVGVLDRRALDDWMRSD